MLEQTCQSGPSVSGVALQYGLHPNMVHRWRREQLQPLVDALMQEILACGMLHADETPVQMRKPPSARDGKTHRAYLWAYAPGAFEATRGVAYDFCESRAGEHARTFLGDWRGSLICDCIVRP